MVRKTVDPLDAGQRNRQKRRKRLVQKWARRALKNRRALLTAFWVAKVILQLVRLISQVFDGS